MLYVSAGSIESVGIQNITQYFLYVSNFRGAITDHSGFFNYFFFLFCKSWFLR